MFFYFLLVKYLLIFENFTMTSAEFCNFTTCGSDFELKYSPRLLFI